MKRALLALLALVLLFFVVRALVHALAGDETKIRWVIEDMADGFDETRMNPIMSGLAQDYVDEGSGYKKDDLRAGLAYLFMQSKKFPYSVRVGWDALHIEVVKGEPRTASVELGAHFYEHETVVWEIAVHGELVRGDDGWRFRRTRVETRSGRQLR